MRTVYLAWNYKLIYICGLSYDARLFLDVVGIVFCIFPVFCMLFYNLNLYLQMIAYANVLPDK